MFRSRSKRYSNNSNNTPFRRTPSFNHQSFKDIESLVADGNHGTTNNSDLKTIHEQQPSSSSSSSSAVGNPRRLSVFHRVRVTNQIFRAFGRSTPEAQESASELKNAAAKSEKSQPSTSSTSELKSAEAISEKSQPSIASAEAKPEKSQPSITIPGAEKRIVVYMTSLRVVRPTFEACKTVQSILRGFRVTVDERDLSMDSSFLDELQKIMAQGQEKETDKEMEKPTLTLPRVFIGGRYVGGAEEIRQLHEAGELKKLVEGLPAAAPGACEVCGGFRFILCSECSGSHKCYTGKGGFRSCTLCNENGLIRCPTCLNH